MNQFILKEQKSSVDIFTFKSRKFLSALYLTNKKDLNPLHLSHFFSKYRAHSNSNFISNHSLPFKYSLPVSV